MSRQNRSAQAQYDGSQDQLPEYAFELQYCLSDELPVPARSMIPNLHRGRAVPGGRGASGKEHRHGESKRGSFPDYNTLVGVLAVRILLAGVRGPPPLRLRIVFPKPNRHWNFKGLSTG